MECNVVWFRNNLRIADHEPLAKAAKENKPLICVYIFDPVFHGTLPLTGLPKTGKFRTKFLLQSLEDLKKSLQNLGNDLLILNGNTAEQLKNICNPYTISGIYTTIEDTAEEIHIEKEVKKQLPQVEFHPYRTNTLLHPDDLPFSISQLPDMFTQFRHAVEKHWEIRSEER
ncbi:MAG TPA: cryptochrome DASH, partial [Cytophagales bacterium]|nr:cryptochrome DASH [Cytophagales bacterium]